MLTPPRNLISPLACFKGYVLPLFQICIFMIHKIEHYSLSSPFHTSAFLSWRDLLAESYAILTAFMLSAMAKRLAKEQSLLLQVDGNWFLIFFVWQDTSMLFLGGLLIAVAMEEVNLHRRIAVGVMRVLGSRVNT